MAEGTTVLENVAKEPHVVDVANFLNSMGADIKGAGTDVIRIKGVNELVGCNYSVIPDQIEAGTFMIAAAATKGDVTITNIIPKHLESISAKLIEMGAIVEEDDDSIRVTVDNKLKKMGAMIKVEGRTAIIDGVENLEGAKVIATDLRAGAAMVIAGLIANGETEIVDIEHIDRGYPHIEEKFRSLGADIRRVVR